MIDSAPINVLDYGAKGDGSTDDSAAIQSALDAASGLGQSVLIPKTSNGTYVVGQQGVNLYCINVPSNTRLIIESGVTIQAKTGIGATVRILSIASASNVYISGYGAFIKGIKSEYVSGEQRHGVIISSSTNVYVEGLTSKDTGGDGFYIGASTCENVTLVDCIADNNRRNGVSITSGKRIVLERCKFTNQTGTAPQAGVDIEPNSNSDFLEDITLRNCYGYNNAGRGYVIASNALPGATAKTININIIDCVDDGGTGTAEGGFSVEKLNVAGNTLSGQIVFENCVSRNCYTSSFSVRNYDATGVPIFFTKCVSINPTRTGVVTAQRYNAPFTVFNESADTGASTIGNVHIKNPIIRYTGSVPNVVDFHFRALAAGTVASKCYVDTPIEVGHAGNANKAYQIGIVNATYIEIIDPYEFYTHLGTETFDAAQAGTTFKNNGAAAAVFTLGARAVGYPDQVFEVTNTAGITITPDAGSTIVPLGTVGQSAQSTQVGASLVLRRDSATSWRIIKQVGTWTAV
jgi:polygalacturonase